MANDELKRKNERKEAFETTLLSEKNVEVIEMVNQKVELLI